jgi:3-phenylpropionate/trans-cinnamate dioxygenase ferredoxin reductase subunit
MDARYAILGGGMVAGYAAKEMAERGLGRGELLIISADSVLPYERPPLSKSFLAGDDSESDILIADDAFYRDHGIDVRPETVVRGVDASTLTLQLEYGDAIRAEQLVIATGARPRRLDVPGGDLPGIYYVRSLDDSRRIRDAYTSAGSAVIIGSGFIGMEVAAVLAQKGAETTILFPGERVWQSFFAPEMSAFFEQYYADRGVRFARGERAARFGGDGRVESVTTASGRTVRSDIVVVGIGVEPVTDVLGGSGLRVEDGVVVDEYLQTEAPGVYAAGDVANYNDVIFQTRRRIEHWDNAVEQGKHVARALLGERVPFVHVPYFFSDVFDLSYEFWGDTTAADDVVYRGDVRTDSFSAWWLRGGRLVAAFLMNRPDEERDLAPRLIEQRAPLTRERLAASSLA